MRKLFMLTCLLCCGYLLPAQETEIQQLIEEGIALHDKGDFDAAIQKYDAALALDKTHYLANYEKTLSLLYSKRYDECIDICKLLLKLDPKNPNTKSVYVNYGSAVDDKGDSKEAVKIYDKGIKAYPDFYLLHYNKGLTLNKMEKPEEALEAMQKGLQYRPLHASPHNAMAIIIERENKWAALLSTLTCLAIEPQGERAKVNVTRMERIMNSNVKQQDEKNITISLSADMLSTKKKKKDNDFGSMEMFMGLTSALDYDSAHKNETKTERLKRKMESMLNVLRLGKDDGKGFFWKFYAPFFDEMEKKNYLDLYTHLAYASSNDNETNQWINENKTAIDEFYQWLKEYNWSK